MANTDHYIVDFLKATNKTIEELFEFEDDENEMIEVLTGECNTLRNTLVKLQKLPSSDHRWKALRSAETDGMELTGSIQTMLSLSQALQMEKLVKTKKGNVTLKFDETASPEKVAHGLKGFLKRISKPKSGGERKEWKLDEDKLRPFCPKIKEHNKSLGLIYNSKPPPFDLSTLLGSMQVSSENATVVEACLRGLDDKALFFLKQNPSIITGKLGDGSTLLHCAANRGHNTTVQLLLDHGAELNAPNEMGIAPLHDAVGSGSKETVSILVKRGANLEVVTTKSMRTDRGVLMDLFQIANEQESNSCPETLDSTNRTPLYTAAANNNNSLVDLLLESGAKVDSKSSTGATPLFAAAYKGYVTVMETLLRHGANPNERPDSQTTIARVAADTGKKDAIDLLAKHGADLKARDGNGYWSPMLVAAGKGDIALMEALRGYGCRLDETLSNGSNLLHSAADSGNTTMVTYLLDAGLDINAKSLGGCALHMASVRNHDAVVKLLLERGADASARAGPHGKMALHAAIDGEKTSTIEVLLSYSPRVDVNCLDEGGDTPLIQAMSNGKEDMARVLLEKGADPNIEGEDGNTALLMATCNHPKLIPLLYQYGADITIENEQGLTPLPWAVNNDDSTIVEALMANERTPEKLFNAMEDWGMNARAFQTLTDGGLTWATYNKKEVACWMILHYGWADVNKIPADTRIPPLTGAIQFGTVGMVKMMLRKGANAELAMYSGLKPIHVAAGIGNHEMARAILEHGCDVNAAGDANGTAMKRAQSRKDFEMVRLLLEFGATAELS